MALDDEPTSSAASDRSSRTSVWLFYPNLIGYARILLALYSMWTFPSSPVCAMLAYALSAGLDAIDGWAARTYNQSGSL